MEPIVEELDVSTKEGLEARHCSYGELLRLDGADNKERGVLATRGLEIDDDSDIDPMKDGVEGFAVAREWIQR